MIFPRILSERSNGSRIDHSSGSTVMKHQFWSSLIPFLARVVKRVMITSLNRDKNSRSSPFSAKSTNFTLKWCYYNLYQILLKSELAFYWWMTKFQWNCLTAYFSVSTASLMLKNANASSYVAFKIKTTAPKRYCVRPNSGLLAPDDIMDVKVMLQPGGTDEKHKFQVQTLIGKTFLK